MSLNITEIEILIASVDNIQAPKELIDVMIELSTHNYYISQIVSQHYTKYNENELKRKNKFNEVKQNLVYKHSYTISKAEAEALINKEVIELKTKEVRHLNAYKKYQLINSSISSICDSIRTKVSYLKQERQWTNIS